MAFSGCLIVQKKHDGILQECGSSFYKYDFEPDYFSCLPNGGTSEKLVKKNKEPGLKGCSIQVLLTIHSFHN
jgi:hypothetical protein